MHYYLAETQLKHLRCEQWLSGLIGHVSANNAQPQI